MASYSYGISYVISAVWFFIVFFLGIIGNSVVLYVLLRQRKTWSITTMYLFNLAIADAVFVAFLPLWGHYYLNELSWTLGLVMCKVAGSLAPLNMFASIFFLTAMSIDRYLAVVKATRINMMRSATTARWVCVIIWFCAVLLSLPEIIFKDLFPRDGSIVENNSTTVMPSLNSTVNFSFASEATTVSENSHEVSSLETVAESVSTTYHCGLYIPRYLGHKKKVIQAAIMLARSVIGFIIPMTAICVCYIRIVLTVKRKVISRKVKKDRIAKLAAFVIGAFFFCWLPYHVINLYSALGGWLELFYADYQFYQTVLPVTICLGYANSFVNPIVYAFTTTNFQENVKDICQLENSAKPYKMTLSNGEHGKDERTPKTQVIHLNTPLSSPICNYRPQCNQQVEVHEMKDVLANPVDSSNPQDQSFSYYSCPAVMEGLNEVQPCCESIKEIDRPYSSPEREECNLSLIKNESA